MVVSWPNGGISRFWIVFQNQAGVTAHSLSGCMQALREVGEGGDRPADILATSGECLARSAQLPSQHSARLEPPR
jgi:hypothetical protein